MHCAVLTNAQVARFGVAEALLSENYFVQTKYSHQVTTSIVSPRDNIQVRRKAYSERHQREFTLTFNKWQNMAETKSSCFRFWLIVMKVELILFNFLVHTVIFICVRCQQRKCYHDFSTLGHRNYARWMFIHLSDKKMLKKPTLICIDQLMSLIILLLPEQKNLFQRWD